MRGVGSGLSFTALTMWVDERNGGFSYSISSGFSLTRFPGIFDDLWHLYFAPRSAEANGLLEMHYQLACLHVQSGRESERKVNAR